MGKLRGSNRKFFNGYGQGIARSRRDTPHLLAAKAALLAPAAAAVEPVFVDKTVFQGKRAVIIGAGVGGLTTAYELLYRELGLEVIVLEARDRTGGRCLTLRTGDTLVQDATDELFPENPEEQVQVVRFDRPLGDSEPYLNAGPGRIPSNHTLLLNYLQRFGVDLEVYIMNSASNLAQIEDKFDSKPLVYRRLEYNTKGYLSQLIWKNAKELIARECVAGGLIGEVSASEQKALRKNLKSLARTFGALDQNGRYIAAANEEGTDDGVSDRAGYSDLPGVGAGTVVPPVPLKDILDSQFWQVNFFQHYSFLWQPTLFQPVGGMDRVQHAFAQQVAALGGTIHLNSPVSSIDWDAQKNKFKITAQRVGKLAPDVYEADYVFSNAAIPFLKKIVTDELFGKFSASFQESLRVVYKAQFGKNRLTREGKKKQREPWKRFLACTNKVGWQAERSLWQAPKKHALQHDGPINDEDLGVIPIFGGISRTTHTITQIWYPSTGYHDKKGILTGCYNYEENAYHFSQLSVADRINLAREGARLFGNDFADGLRCGVTIAWHHMPYIKGGWTQWQFVGTNQLSNVDAFNNLIEGTPIAGSESKFFIVGDQLSSQPGWQEGAVASAVNAVNRLLNPTSQLGYLSSLPDTRISVQGI